MNEGKGNTVLLTIIGIATLLIAVIGATFAYFTAILSGEETGVTMTLKSGTIGTVFNGGAAINAAGIFPREESQGEKIFTINGTSLGTSKIFYDLGLVVTTNTFSPGALKYSLTVDPSSSNNGTYAPEKIMVNIPNSGTADMGQGFFQGPTEDAVHRYKLNIYFPDTGISQNKDQNKILYAHISIGAETSGQTTQP